MRRVVVIFVKQPRPGAVKTRLAAGVGEARAAELASAFMRDTLATIQRVSSAPEVWIAFDPPAAGAYFERLFPGATCLPQAPGDLGARMQAAIQSAMEASGAPASCLAIGGDAPHIGTELYEAAFASLQGQDDVCVAPAEDGGYVLLGQRSVHTELFRDMPWSQGHLLEATLSRAASSELSVRLLPTQFDVDHFEDLERLEALLREDPTIAPATAELLLS